MKKVENVIIYTDGSGKNNNSPGGWAFYNETDTDIHSGYKLVTNSTDMEICAVVNALHYIRTNNLKATIITDHKGIVEALAKNAKIWEENNWKTSNGNLANASSWKELIRLWRALQEKHKLIIHWTPSHQGEHGNELVDKFAKKERQKAEIVHAAGIKQSNPINKIKKIIESLHKQQKITKKSDPHMEDSLIETAIEQIKLILN
jgi:ribonuclease HI